MQKEFQSKKIHKLLEQYKPLIPKLKKIVFFKHQSGVLVAEFYDEDLIDITDKISEIILSDETTLYNTILSQLNTILINIELNSVFYYRVKTSIYKFNLFNKGAFTETRFKRNLSINQLSIQANIYNRIIYSLENGEGKNFTVDTLVKYMLFFRKPFFYFLKPKYKKEFAAIYADELADNNLISEQERDAIVAHYS
jgi:hypothetical protein